MSTRALFLIELWGEFCRAEPSLDGIAIAALDLARGVFQGMSEPSGAPRTDWPKMHHPGATRIWEAVSTSKYPAGSFCSQSFSEFAEIAGGVTGQKVADFRYRALRHIRRERRIRFDRTWIPVVRSLVEWAASKPEGSFEALCGSLSLALQRVCEYTVDYSAGLLEGLIVLDELLARPSSEQDSHARVRLRTVELDREILTNRFFGLHTSMKDFDGIFAGGLLLPDPPASNLSGGAIDGRITVLAGPFGSGKSILSALLAIEVARKGGAALVVLPEQSTDEWQLSLQQMNADVDPRCMEILSIKDFKPKERPDDDGRGVLVLASPAASGVEEFLQVSQSHVMSLRPYPLRLVVIDPVDAFLDNGLGEPETNAEPGCGLSRKRTFDLFALAKRWGVNLLLTTEVESKSEHTGFIENTADTVIHLDRETTDAAVTRKLEVTKSRLQKQLQGTHTLILDDKGLRVYPSFATLRSIQPKFRKAPPKNLRFGARGMSSLLGPAGLRSGNIVVLAGDGRSKTRVGFEFLCPFEENETSDLDAGWSLLITERDKDEMRGRVHSLFETSASRRPRLQRFATWRVRVGYSDPGQLMYELLEGIEHHRSKGQLVDRLMIHSIARWEESMPLFRHSAMFGVELLGMLRDFGLTSVIVSAGSTRYGETPLRNVMLDYSDVLLTFSNREIRGEDRTFIRAVKTAGMEHSQESMELSSDSLGLQIRDAPLIRMKSDGNVAPRALRFFLFAETDRHKKLNDEILHGIKSFLTDDVEIKGLFRADLPVLRLGNLSVLDELQIVQLDEHQTPSLNTVDPGIKLHRLPTSLVKDLWQGLLVDPERRLASRDNHSFCVVPFYLNISFLLYSPAGAAKLGHPDWQNIATQCETFKAQDWADEYGKEPDLFFYCPVYEGSRETYNCLFLEILRSLREKYSEATTHERTCNLMEWLQSGLAGQAANIFRTVCSQGHLKYYKRAHERIGSETEPPPTHGTRATAVITRHWYNTMNQYASEMGNLLNKHRVGWLPGDITTAGEWYLGIPITSAAPRTTLEFIRDLTSKEREQRRLEEGVGLPMRKEYYRHNAKRISISPFVNLTTLDIPRVYERATRRSDFGCYNEVSGTISQHLIWLLEHYDNAGEVMESLRTDIASLTNNSRCGNCM